MTDVTPMRIGADLVTTDEVSVVTSPYDDHEVGRVPVGTEEHIDRAVAVAVARRDGEPLSASDRAAVLDRAAARLAERREEFARLVAEEAAKPIATARVEIDRACDTFRFSAAVARTLTGETVPMDASGAGAHKLGIVLRVPIGVVGAISPFNFPVNLVVHKIGPAIAVGCPVVLKPASATPLSALALARMLVDECGLPDGWLNVVDVQGLHRQPPGRAPRRRHDHLHRLAAGGVGHPGAGAAQAGRPRARQQRPGDRRAVGGLGGRRRQDHRGRHVLRRAVVHLGAAGLRPPLDRRGLRRPAGRGLRAPDRRRPPRRRHRRQRPDRPGETERVSSWITDAVDAGARIVVGGAVDDDGVLAPTVLADVTPDMEVCRTEVFGPLVGVQVYDEVDEALRLANDTRYGLQAGIFTADLDTALLAARTLDFGGVTVNEVPTWRADQMPYGGVRDSGNTREGPAYAARHMTEERLVVIHSGSLP